MGQPSVDFGRDILPLLSDRCFQCHGPDEANREAELRLDRRPHAIASGAIVPGDPAASEMVRRIDTDDDDLRMPPADSHKPLLTDDEIEMVRAWIAQGAPWSRHWAFVRPVRPPVPDDAPHPIDAFILNRLKRENLHFSVPAAKHTLLRRVCFDLTGLPPSPDDLQRALEGSWPDAYLEWVEACLASPHYGERMAMWWLDAARYADTDGYQQDETRENWPWRDWVVNSFNRNMRFDEFTRWQFAGDLFPAPQPEQILATCFHRNHMTNGEGGRDPEESRIDYVIDRVNSTGTVWLGLTLGCAQCHDHKFDPITQQDYYGLAAFFYSIDEDGRAGRAAKPYLEYTSSHVAAAIAEAERVLNVRFARLQKIKSDLEPEFERWLNRVSQQVIRGFWPWKALDIHKAFGVEGTQLVNCGEGVLQATGPNPVQDDYHIIATPRLKRVTGWRLEVYPSPNHTDGKLSRGKSGEFILTDVKLMIRKRGSPNLRDVPISSAVADVSTDGAEDQYGRITDTLDDDPRNGWTTQPESPWRPHVAVFGLAEPVQLSEDEELIFVLLHRSTRGDASIGRFRITVTDQPGQAVRHLGSLPLEQLAHVATGWPPVIDNGLRDRLFDQFLTDQPAFARAEKEYRDAKRQLDHLKQESSPRRVMVLRERSQPRATHVLVRGQWDQHGDQVEPHFPADIFQWTAPQTPTRMDLANWLVTPENPLTARVVANHLWQLCFGRGLVATPDDFGLQGARPSHPELLDWLAVELIESGWDIQHMLRLIVTSRTYQQTSRVSPGLLDRDPQNRLLARGARFRLPSWMIRDAALASSGLLNRRVGGPPVMPYQPPGVWNELFMGRFTYHPSQGPAQHRRSLYSFWRRAAAPTFLFDSAQRRVCEVRPRRTNTPLHALVLLNDLSLRESARELARRSLIQSTDDDRRIQNMAFAILSRALEPDELVVARNVLDSSRTYYQANRDEAFQFLDFGQVELGPTSVIDVSLPQWAGYTVVAGMLLNLDEASTHE